MNRLIIILVLFIPTVILADNTKPIKVLRVINNQDKNPQQIIFNSGSADGLHEDMLFKVFRTHKIDDPYFQKNHYPANITSKNTILVEVAKIRALKVSDYNSVAQIESLPTGSDLNVLEYPRVMTGDLVMPVKISVHKVMGMSETYTFFDKDLFTTETYNIKPEHLRNLVNIANGLATFKGGKVIIEGHTFRAGNKQLNRTKSLKKAQLMKQFIVRFSDLKEEDVVCVGYGEDQLLKNNNLPSESTYNNRIIIKYIDTETNNSTTY